TQEVPGKDGQTPLFHVPLTVRFVVDDKTHDIPLTITRADETFVYPLHGKPAQAILDPGNHFLKTLDMKKPDEVWRGELAAAEQVHQGEASYFVEAESALTLAKTRATTAFDSLEEAMKRPSYLDVIESLCLAGMAELRDERGIDVALEAARYGKPIIGRRA